MSIPGISAGMLAGAGWLSDPTREGTPATLTGVAADDSWPEVSINGPKTAMAATAAPTDTTRIPRHRKVSQMGPLSVVSLLRSAVLLIILFVQPSRGHGAEGP